MRGHPVNSQERNQKFPSFWQAVLVVVALLVAQIFAGIVLQLAGVKFTSGDPRGSVITVLACGVAFSGLLAYKKLGYRQLFNPSGLPIAVSVGPVLLPLLAFCLGVFILSWELSNLVFHAFPMSDEQQVSMAELLSGGVVSLVTLCIVAPFIEEMLFRGLFLRSFLNNYSPWQAIVLSSFIFGLTHFYVNHIIVATVLGVAMGWLYYTTRSLWPSVIAHAIQNGGALLSVYVVPESLAQPEPVSFPVTSFPAVLTGIVALAYGVKRIRSMSCRPSGTYQG